MLTCDLEMARRFVAKCPPPGELLHVGVVGAHYYGFASADSDVDLKGIHLAPMHRLLGLTPPAETHERLEVFENVEHDLTTHEAQKALTLLLRGNGNVLERLMAPLQLVESPELEDLRALSAGALSTRFAAHYQGYFRAMCREHAKADAPRAKSLLYAYRVALTGVHLLLTGEVRGDVLENAREHGFTDVEELVAFKRDAAERSPLPADLDLKHRERWPKLAERLEHAADRSPLPDDPADPAALDAWLVARRLATGAGCHLAPRV